MKKEEKEYEYIQLRVKPVEKSYIQYQAEKEKVTMTEYILRRVLPEKYEHVRQLEEKWQSELSARHKS